MKIEQVALICYTIRDLCQTEDDFARAMAQVADIGYRAVQISGVGPIEPSHIRRICDENGLTICASHENGQKILTDPEPLFDKLRTFGCTDTVFACPAFEQVKDGFGDLADQLAVAADRFADAGLRLSYHNHAFEFARYPDGLGMDNLFTRAPQMSFELDTYWIQYGGASPVDWCAKCAGRLPLLHLKDYALFEWDTVHEVAIGDGNLNWPDIITTAEASGCQWFIVEQDNHWHHNDPMAAARRSFEYIAANLV